MHRTFAAARAYYHIARTKKSARLSANHNKQTDRRRAATGQNAKKTFACTGGRSLVKSSGKHPSLSIGFTERASVCFKTI